VPFQSLSKKDKQRIVDDRISVGNEIFASCLAKANALLKNEFASDNNGSSVWHEQDKNRAVEVAKLIFCRVVSINDVREMADEVHTPEIDDIKLTRDEDNGEEDSLKNGLGSF